MQDRKECVENALRDIDIVYHGFRTSLNKLLSPEAECYMANIEAVRGEYARGVYERAVRDITLQALIVLPRLLRIKKVLKAIIDDTTVDTVIPESIVRDMAFLSLLHHNIMIPEHKDILSEDMLDKIAVAHILAVRPPIKELEKLIKYAKNYAKDEEGQRFFKEVLDIYSSTLDLASTLQTALFNCLGLHIIDLYKNEFEELEATEELNFEEEDDVGEI